MDDETKAQAIGERSDRSHRWVVVAICAYALATVAVLPVAHLKVAEIPAITPFVVGVMVATDFATGFLLFTRFRDESAWPLLLRAAAYLHSGVMVALHLLTFPDAVLPYLPRVSPG